MIVVPESGSHTKRRAWTRRVLGSDLTPTQRNVLIALATFANDRDGTNAHPGEAQLAAMCGLTTRAVRTALRKGRETGLIARTGAGNDLTKHADVYRLAYATGTAVPVNNSDTGTIIPVNNCSTGTATSPQPELRFRPSEHSPKELEEEPSKEPSKFCDAHPQGTADPCWACARARTARAAWQADQMAIRKARRAQRRADCPWCDNNGMRDIGGDTVARCDHQPPPLSLVAVQ